MRRKIGKTKGTGNNQSLDKSLNLNFSIQDRALIEIYFKEKDSDRIRVGLPALCEFGSRISKVLPDLSSTTAKICAAAACLETGQKQFLRSSFGRLKSLCIRKRQRKNKKA